MKSILFVFVAVMIIAAPVRAQVMDTTDSPESVIAPVASPTTACILGDLPDGTPPPPAPPKPVFNLPSKNVLSTTTHQQGGRTITLQRIKPIALPQPSATGPAPLVGGEITSLDDPSTPLADPSLWTPLSLGVTVYRFTDSPPRSLVRYRPDNGVEPVTFWSSADFGLLSGFGDFAAANGHTYSLYMAWGYEDVGSMADFSAIDGSGGDTPGLPGFPDGEATFTLTSKPPADPEILVPIRALHDIYNHELARLKAASEGRERAQLQREAELKANPPRPKNITLNYWRTERPAPAKGGAK